MPPQKTVLIMEAPVFMLNFFFFLTHVYQKTWLLRPITTEHQRIENNSIFIILK